MRVNSPIATPEINFARQIQSQSRYTRRNIPDFCNGKHEFHSAVQNAAPCGARTYVIARQTGPLQNSALSRPPLLYTTTACGLAPSTPQIKPKTELSLVSICTPRYSTQAFTNALALSSPSTSEGPGCESPLVTRRLAPWPGPSFLFWEEVKEAFRTLSTIPANSRRRKTARSPNHLPINLFH